jgi:hypothetical protein
MKAYIATLEGEDWCILIHGETRGKAKARFLQCEPSGWHDSGTWNTIRLTRLPGQDDLPFTYENSQAAGFVFSDEVDFEMSTEITEQQRKANYSMDCNCPLCNKPPEVK